MVLTQLENDFYPLPITTEISTVDCFPVFFPDCSTANRHDPAATIASPNRRSSPSALDIRRRTTNTTLPYRASTRLASPDLHLCKHAQTGPECPQRLRKNGDNEAPGGPPEPERCSRRFGATMPQR